MQKLFFAFSMSACLFSTLFFSDRVYGQTPAGIPGMLKQQLVKEDSATLAAEALKLGDTRRGAILFYQPYLTCTKCHTAGQQGKPLGPELTKLGAEATGAYLVESILKPSLAIKKGFESVVIVTNNGKSITGILVEETPQHIVLRDSSQNGKLITVPKVNIDEKVANKLSLMPQGLVNQLAGKQQFLDLIRYLIEIAQHGPQRALELKPSPALYAARPLPEYEQHIDHAGMIANLNADSFQRGEAIYNRLCINCHGTHHKPGSLPTSLRFATGKFKNGSEPYTMYQTLTRGFGMMVPQTWMVPKQKHDVIHYIREAYLKEHNPTQYVPITKTYLAGLPKGNTRGPEPVLYQPWVTMDYGPSLINTYEAGNDGSNFAYKGIAARLDSGPGGVSRGRYWMVFDHDTLRMAAGWNGTGFIDWKGIQFDGQHAVHPRVTGQTHFANPIGPGWANPKDGSFTDTRFKGRDGKLYGPLPRNWAHYKGLYHHEQRTIISYTVGNTNVLEMPGVVWSEPETQTDDKTESVSQPTFTRTFNIGPRQREMILQVANNPTQETLFNAFPLENHSHTSAVLWGPKPSATSSKQKQAVAFDGNTSLEVTQADDFNMTSKDFSIVARIRTRKGGTVFCKTQPGEKWIPNGKTFFIRGGRVCFDIGWVGAVQSRRRVNDGKWHDVAMTWDHKTGIASLYIDGEPDAQKTLRPKGSLKEQVVRIGYSAPNFPQPQSFFDGEIDEVRFYKSVLSSNAVSPLEKFNLTNPDLIAFWKLTGIKGNKVRDSSGRQHTATVHHGTAASNTNMTLLAGIVPVIPDRNGITDGLTFVNAENGNLRLRIPAGKKPLKFTLWTSQLDDQKNALSVVDAVEIEEPAQDLTQFTKGGPPRWPDLLKTAAIIGNSDGPYAVDVLTHPLNNPWLCQIRPTGFDFYPNADLAAVSTWDGDVWLVSGMADPKNGLTWKRIASGLFQPLGVKIVDQRIYVTCRDQIVILNDLNGDGETDFYENFNNDHQVTEHFHEFAMGLQTDAAGNFYYAKSARHALTALVAHHGTLLRVSKDGSRTDILATGFRAANGVCLNPDGTFIVTDQEGHWNPKNRINWVKEGGFYGNMFGYHDVTNPSDDAMEQPLCWITNTFDRSPAELLWADSNKWGPLEGSLLNLSYGYGKVYVVPHETVNGQVQGGMCELPLPQFPTGIIRGRFHPQNGQLYTCGMFAWAGSQQQPGGFYRIRYTGKPVHLPLKLNAHKNGMSITFSGKLDPKSATDLNNYAVKIWSLKRTANYGSKHYNEHNLPVTSATLSQDGKTLFLEIPSITPTWSMEIRYSLRSDRGQKVDGTIHNTIHNLGDAVEAGK
jgi:putative heme-binding domain-containing protein